MTTLTIDDVYEPIIDANGRIIQRGTRLNEGGYSNRMNDNGGATNFGIRQATLNEYNQWDNPLKTGQNFPQQVQNLTADQAKQIYDEMYFKRYMIDRLSSQQLARQVFDHLVNAGTGSVGMLADELNQMNNTDFRTTNKTVSQGLADYLNAQSPEFLQQLGDRFNSRRMEHLFQAVDTDPERNINNLNGWYQRVREYHSDPALFDAIHYQNYLNYKNRYDTFYNGE